jgi:phosphoribosyl-ATP pyrophosphohydrolase
VHPPGGVLERARTGAFPVDESKKKFTLNDLAARVKERASASADTSYTRKLLDKGVGHCAKKFGEEAVETVLAAVSEDRDRLVSETADLLYHLMVLLEARGVALADVEAALAARLDKSGLEEKASRPRK